jgi:putative oxidoreductase
MTTQALHTRDVITEPKNNTTASTTTAQRRTDKLSGATLSAFRVVVSFLFLCHGLAGFGLFGGIDGAGAAVPVGTWPLWWAGLIEVVTAVLIGLGLFTRTAALLASGTMAYAYFTMHQAVALLPLQNLGEPAALYAWIFLLIAVLGPGSLTVRAIARRRR